MKPRQRIRHWVVGVTLAGLMYVGSYCCLSWGGAYYFAQSGKVRYAMGLSVSDLVLWQPRYARWQMFVTIHGGTESRGNSIGYLYAPMIVLDRWLVHPTEVLIESGG